MRRLKRRLALEDWVGHGVWLLLFALLVALVLSAAFHPRVLALAFVLAVMLAIGLLWPWLQILSVRGYLVLRQHRAQVGRPTEVSAAIHNRGLWPVTGLLVQAEGDSVVDGRAVWIPSIPPLRTADVRWSVVPGRRGLFPQRTPRVSTTFPFRFSRGRRKLPVRGELLVWPRTVCLDALVAGDDQALPAELESIPRGSGSSGEFLGAREYRSGDSLRRIHWPQTARQDRLIVCEMSATARRGVHVVVNTDPAAQFSADEHSSLERVLSIAASLADASVRQRRSITLALSPELLVEATDTATLHAVLDCLARWGSPATTVPREVRVTTSRIAPAHRHCFLLTTAEGGNLHRPADSPQRMAFNTAIVVTDSPLRGESVRSLVDCDQTCFVPVSDEHLVGLSRPQRYSQRVPS